MFKYCCLQPASSLACLGRVSLAKELAFTGMSRKPKERNFPTKHDRFKNPNWREADQLTIYKHDREVELGSTEKQLQRPATRDPRLRSFRSGPKGIGHAAFISNSKH